VERNSRPFIREAIIRDGCAADHPAAAAVQIAAFGEVHWAFDEEPFKVAEIEGETVAYLVWRRTFTDEFEILSLATHPNHRRKGLARALVREFCSRNHGDIFLEVRESNVGAIACYEALGFKKTGVRHSYYANTGEGAIVMKLRSGRKA
jgi:ribosomal-protein-alanine acetyltransferase